jgi:hypothetical protein
LVVPRKSLLAMALGIVLVLQIDASLANDLRVSTSEQTTCNQRRELHAVAERHEWHVVATYEDAGISGAKGRDKRPALID